MADASSPASNQSTMASQILTTLGAGSGIDIHKMAQDLTDVEKLPKQEQINNNITSTNAQISGYGLVTYQLGILKGAFEGINDASEMATSTSTSTNTTAVNFSSLDGTAQVGSYDVSVSALANGPCLYRRYTLFMRSGKNGGKTRGVNIFRNCFNFDEMHDSER